MTRMRGDDRGSSTALVVVLATAILLGIGLGVDGSTALRASRTAETAAAEAARAGGQAVSFGSALGGGGAVADPGTAVAGAQDYLAARGIPGSVTVVDGTHLQVSTTVSRPTTLLGIIGIGQVTGTGTATARIASGVGEEGT